MRMLEFAVRAGVLTSVLCGGMSSWGQVLTITNGAHTYVSITNTQITLGGRSELHVTASSNPVPGCTVNLTGSDAWLFLPNIKPSTVVSTLLGQTLINGVAAAADANCRVVEYGVGAVVIPHASSFQPLQVYDGPHFTGSSASFGKYVYYTGNGLGAMNAKISSFRLKRGYTATFAQFENGGGASRNYVAADGDLEVTVLPNELDDDVRFIYVLPWRWVSKKGSCDVSPDELDAQWWYNWNISENSTRDREYVAIRQQPYWPGLNQNWQTRGVNHLSGYNEPNNPVEDAYKNLTPPGSVDDAVARWPELLATGLRVGAPAVTDGGQGWITEFMSQAGTAGRRVDYVPIHYYRSYSNNDNPAGAASQLYNFLKGIYDVVKRPLWVTEFNNGANWTGDPDPSFAQNAAVIQAMIQMMDDTPWVERYSIYSRVEEVRQTHYNAGGLTPMGVMYRDHQAPIAYLQGLQDNGTRSVTELRLDGNTLDSTGHGNNGITTGSPAYTNGQRGQALVFDGVHTKVTLPPNLATSNAFTFAAWVQWKGGGNWQRLFDFGNSTTHYLFLTPSSGSGTLRFTIRDGGGEQIVETGALPQGQWRHVAVTLAGNTARLYINGTQVAVNSSMSITPAAFSPRVNLLGDSQFVADPLFNGLMDEVLIADYALAPGQIAALLTNTPPQFTNSVLARGAATEGVAYNDTLAGTAADADPGDTLTYSKATGPAWLNVAADGTLGGSPTSVDGGTNVFTVRVTDPAGQSGFALLNIEVSTVPRVLARYDFEGNALSSIGTAHGTVSGTAAYPSGRTGQAIDLDGVEDFVTLPAGLGNSDDLTLAAWVNWDGGGAWQRIFDFGNGTSQYFFLTPNSGDGTMRFAIKNGGGEQIVQTSPLAVGQWKHVAFTLTGATGRLYVDGVLVASSPVISITPSSINPSQNYLGESQFAADPLFNGRLDEVVVANYGMSTAQVALLMTNHPPQFTNSILVRGDAGEGQPYGDTLAGSATDGDAIAGLSYSKAAGPGWLQVAPDGLLSGTPTPFDVGTNMFTVRVNDFAGAGALATLILFVNDLPTPAVTLTNTDAAGTSSFNTAGNWDSGAPPSAFADYFTSVHALRTPEGTGDYTFGGSSLTLSPNGSASGSLLFKGLGTRTYTFSRLWLTGGLIRSGSGSQDTCILAGDVSLVGGTVSTIQADQGPFVVAAPIDGSGALQKSGGYTTTLSGANSYSGDTLVTAGTLRVGAGPVVHMSFDNVIGLTVVNGGTGGSSMNGILTGGGASVVAGGRYGNALNLNGTASYVRISNRVAPLDCGTGGGAWTYALWLKTSTAGAKYGYQGNGGWNASAQTTFYLNANSTAAGGTRAGGVRWGDSWLTGTATLNDNAWHFIAITVSGGRKTIYVDGNVDAQTGATGWNAAGSATANQFWIGGSPNTGDGTANLNGLIDEVYIYDRALSQAEVQQLMVAPSGGPAGLARALSPSSLIDLSAGARLDLNGSTQVVPGVTGTGVVDTTPVGGAATLVVSNALDQVFSGSLTDTSGSLALTKSGPASFTLGGAAQTHVGPTLVEQGALLVNGQMPFSAVTVANGGVLGGVGVLGSPVSVQSGGTLAPGTGIGLLWVNSSLTLQPGSTTLMEISKAPPAADLLRVSGTMVRAGTLTVTPVAGPLAAGDSFQLFDAPVTTGSFAVTNLPPLGPGLAWDLSQFHGGYISVAAAPPQFDSIARLGDGSVQLTGSGVPGWDYALLATTNLASPIVWTAVTNATADGGGVFQFIDADTATHAQRFYQVEGP